MDHPLHQSLRTTTRPIHLTTQPATAQPKDQEHPGQRGTANRHDQPPTTLKLHPSAKHTTCLGGSALSQRQCQHW